MRTPSEENASIELPKHLYPAFAPLAVPLAQHLVQLEYQQNRSAPTRAIWSRVLERVTHARRNVFEYMDDFVQEDAQKPRRRGRGKSFPDEKWFLDELRNNTPTGNRPVSVTLYDWQQRGLLLREWPRGPFDLDSVAALLIARMAEDEHERGWLPSSLDEEEPRWWCYGREYPDAPIMAVPVPLPELPPSTLLWTHWRGAAWRKWASVGNVACCWSPSLPTQSDLAAYKVKLP